MAQLPSSKLIYRGCFRWPAGPINGVTMEYPGVSLAYVPSRNSVYVPCKYNEPPYGGFAEIAVPGTLHIPTQTQRENNDETGMPVGAVLTNPKSAHGTAPLTSHGMSSNGAIRTGGLCVVPGAPFGWANREFLIWAVWNWYNVDGHTVAGLGRSELLHNADLDAQGPYHLTGIHNNAYGGNVTYWPTADARIGGHRLACGNWIQQGISTSSYGPGTTIGFTIPATPPAPGTSLTPTSVCRFPTEALKYPQAQPSDLNFTDGTPQGHGVNDMWRGSVYVYTQNYEAMIAFGRKGLTDNYYQGTEGNPAPVPPARCYDPNTSGYFGEPYYARGMFFDPAEYAAVIAGSKAQHEVRHYEIWDLTAAGIWFKGCDKFSFGAAFDPAGPTIYLGQVAAYDVGGGALNIIHVLDVDDTPGIPGQAPGAISGAISTSASVSGATNVLRPLAQSSPIVITTSATAKADVAKALAGNLAASAVVSGALLSMGMPTVDKKKKVRFRR